MRRLFSLACLFLLVASSVTARTSLYRKTAFEDINKTSAYVMIVDEANGKALRSADLAAMDVSFSDDRQYISSTVSDEDLWVMLEKQPGSNLVYFYSSSQGKFLYGSNTKLELNAAYAAYFSWDAQKSALKQDGTNKYLRQSAGKWLLGSKADAAAVSFYLRCEQDDPEPEFSSTSVTCSDILGFMPPALNNIGDGCTVRYTSNDVLVATVDQSDNTLCFHRNGTTVITAAVTNAAGFTQHASYTLVVADFTNLSESVERLTADKISTGTNGSFSYQSPLTGASYQGRIELANERSIITIKPYSPSASPYGIFAHCDARLKEVAVLWHQGLPSTATLSLYASDDNSTSLASIVQGTAVATLPYTNGGEELLYSNDSDSPYCCFALTSSQQADIDRLTVIWDHSYKPSDSVSGIAHDIGRPHEAYDITGRRITTARGIIISNGSKQLR